MYIYIIYIYIIVISSPNQVKLIHVNSPSCSLCGEHFVEFILSTTLEDKFFWSFCFQDALCSTGGSPASGFEGRPEEGQVHHRALPRRLLLTARQGTTGRPVDKVRCRWFPRGLVSLVSMIVSIVP